MNGVWSQDACFNHVLVIIAASHITTHLEAYGNSVLSTQFFSKSKTAPKLSINLKIYILETPPCKNNHRSVVRLSVSFPCKYIYICSEPFLNKGMPFFFF